MRKAIGAVWSAPLRFRSAPFFICAGAFFLGGVVSLLVARHLNAEGTLALQDYISLLFSAVRGGQVLRPTFIKLLWEGLRWALMAILCGLTFAGIPLYPVLFFSRGFMLCFAIGSLLCVMPQGGARAAFVLFELSALITIPALFLLGSLGFQQCLNRCSTRDSGRFRMPPKLAVGIGGALLAGLLIEYYIVPVLFSALAYTVPLGAIS